MSADVRLLVDLDLGPAHRSRLTAVSELFYFTYYCVDSANARRGEVHHPRTKQIQIGGRPSF